MPVQTRSAVRPPPATTRGRKRVRAKAQPVATHETASTDDERSKACRDESPGPSSHKKRQKSSVSKAQAQTHASASTLEVKMASLESRYDAHEAALAALSGRLLAVESRLPRTGGDAAAAPSPDAHVDDAADTGPLSSRPHDDDDDDDDDNDNDRMVVDALAPDTDPKPGSIATTDQGKGGTVKVPKKVVATPEQSNRWHHRELFGHSNERRLIDTLWPTVKHDVDVFCRVAFPKQVSMDLLAEETKDWISSWAPNFREYVHQHNNMDGRLFELYKAVVWHILYEELFSPYSEHKWQKGGWAGLGAMLRQVLPDVTNKDDDFTFTFFTCKRQAARMIYMSDTREHADVKTLQDQILRRLENLIDPARPEGHDLTVKALRVMAESAIQADLFIVASCLHFTVEVAHPETGEAHGFTFQKEPKLMEAAQALNNNEKDDREGRPVAFIVEPVLRSRGSTTSSPTYQTTHIDNLLTRIYAHKYHEVRVESRMSIVLEPRPEERPETPYMLGRN